MTPMASRREHPATDDDRVCGAPKVAAHFTQLSTVAGRCCHHLAEEPSPSTSVDVAAGDVVSPQESSSDHPERDEQQVVGPPRLAMRHTQVSTVAARCSQHLAEQPSAPASVVAGAGGTVPPMASGGDGPQTNEDQVGGSPTMVARLTQVSTVAACCSQHLAGDFSAPASVGVAVGEVVSPKESTRDRPEREEHQVVGPPRLTARHTQVSTIAAELGQYLAEQPSRLDGLQRRVEDVLPADALEQFHKSGQSSAHATQQTQNSAVALRFSQIPVAEPFAAQLSAPDDFLADPEASRGTGKLSCLLILVLFHLPVWACRFRSCRLLQWHCCSLFVRLH